MKNIIAVPEDTRDQMVARIKQICTETAYDARRNAALGGEMGDGGAQRTVDAVGAWADGYKFARTGVSDKYGHLVHNLYVQSDPEYQKYLDLKQRFEPNGN
jgi:hypothetical protein